MVACVCQSPTVRPRPTLDLGSAAADDQFHASSRGHHHHSSLMRAARAPPTSQPGRCPLPLPALVQHTSPTHTAGMPALQCKVHRPHPHSITSSPTNHVQKRKTSLTLKPRARRLLRGAEKTLAHSVTRGNATTYLNAIKL